MTPLQEKLAPRYPRRNAAEDRAWSRLYRRAGKPAVAAEVVQHLESDAESQRFHLALYLRCRETLRRCAARRARLDRIARLARTVLDALRTLMPRQHETPAFRPSEAPTQRLASIEQAAERACAPLLRTYLARIDAERLALDGEDRAYADALVLKLHRLLREHQVEPGFVDPRAVVPFEQRGDKRHELSRSAA
jgi:hypothetical protein